jgi:hypothetical protein
LQKSEAVTHTTTTGHVTSPPIKHKVLITRAPPITSTNSSGFSKFINDVFQVITSLSEKPGAFSALDSKSLHQSWKLAISFHFFFPQINRKHISVFGAKFCRNVSVEIIYTGCPRRNVPDFGRVFLMLKYTDITQNTYIQS